ncbi:hypothetical protein C8F04DRAFT_1065183 [Mycena alexandri]|uniref:RING-type domain-containing protein n=1 Tax=Mycena alexandri TaxID=1745969 RepID=A0AAD6TG36_9AGAR|nr:hypothetical protein C8F04DRAFT_1065183 [Mycena alexandri]
MRMTFWTWGSFFWLHGAPFFRKNSKIGGCQTALMQTHDIQRDYAPPFSTGSCRLAVNLAMDIDFADRILSSTGAARNCHKLLYLTPVSAVMPFVPTTLSPRLGQMTAHSPKILEASPLSQSPNTTVAMIALYVVTGVVSFLFCIILVAGAIKAIRHPERYGPRPGNNDGEAGWSESRARGLTRAILDTFPIVKFGTPHAGVAATKAADDQQRDPEIHLPEMKKSSSPSQSAFTNSVAGPSGFLLDQNEHNPPPASLLDASGAREAEATIPAAIGRETCPICIVDFEEGDDLRVLPCDGAHRFHQHCVDPWLLALSTECPICRHDFIALQNMISAGSEDDLESDRRTSRLRRFSRYLRFARHEREQDIGSGEAHDFLQEPVSSSFPSSPV